MQVLEDKIRIMEKIAHNNDLIIRLLEEEVALYKNFINSIGKKNDKTKESK